MLKSFFKSLDQATNPGTSWYDNEIINKDVNCAVKAGWIRRYSYTQCQWTQKGLDAWREVEKINFEFHFVDFRYKAIKEQASKISIIELFWAEKICHKIHELRGQDLFLFHDNDNNNYFLVNIISKEQKSIHDFFDLWSKNKDSFVFKLIQHYSYSFCTKEMKHLLKASN